MGGASSIATTRITAVTFGSGVTTPYLPNQTIRSYLGGYFR